MTKNEMLLEITKTLRQHPSVRVAYLFGSMARGTEREVAARRNYWDKLPYAEEYSRCLAERRKHQTSKSPSHAPGA